MLWLVAAILAFGLGGATALVLGLRGRRIDDHPVCRRCGFDLIGQAPPAPPAGAIGDDAGDLTAADPPRCSECGVDLSRRRAIRLGQRRRRPVVATLGAVALLAALSGAGAIGWAAATKFDWNTVKPVWMLGRELSSADSAVAGAAVDELRQRLADDRLAPVRDGTRDTRAAKRLARRIVDYQGETDRPWNRGAGEIFERMWEMGLLPEEIGRQFVARSSPMRIHIRPRVPRGQPLPVRFDVERREGGGMLSCRVALVDIIVGGEVLETGSYWFYVPLGNRQSAWRSNNDSSVERIQFLPEYSVALSGHQPYIPPGLDLPPGRWPLRLRMVIRREVLPPGQRTYSRGVSRGPSSGPEPDGQSLVELARHVGLWSEDSLPEGPPVFELVEFETEIEIVEPGAAVVALATGAEAEQIADRIAATARLQPSGYGNPEAGSLAVNVTVDKNLPLDVCYRASLSLPDGSARDLGWFAHEPQRDAAWGRAFGLPLGPLTHWAVGDTLRIIFTPDPVAAASQADMNEIAGAPFEVELSVPEPP